MKYNKREREIVSNRELSKLDKLTLEFIDILKKYTDYVIVSGYVSIILGRSRATEDIDIFVKKFSKDKFDLFFKNLKRNGFWCINAKSGNNIFNYLKNNTPIRIAKKNTFIPNFELKYPKNKLEEASFRDFLIVRLKTGKLKISSLERQIAFKRYFLKSNKDIEDALHIEEIFRDDLDYRKIDKLKESINKL